MSILIASSWSEAIATSDPKVISWVGPGNRYEVRTGSDMPPELPTSLPQPGSGLSADSLSASSGASLIGFKPAGTGMATRTLDKKLSEIPTLLDAYGAPDYAGAPLYDGQDGTRVTASDNTLALSVLISRAISDGSGVVRIPAGRWGIKTGNLSFSGFSRLVFVGEGIGVSILDFIKEDSSKSAYVDNEGAVSANCIAKFETGQGIEFRDLTIKATTKLGVVNGTTGPSNGAAVYYGAVWGLKIKNVVDVRFTRVRIERFNYRGVSVYGSQTQRVVLHNCEGFHNTAAGFWVSDAALLWIAGGEYAYNGIRGNPGTGYGVTASSNVGKVVSIGAYYHNNYRKGLDSHGCGGAIVLNNVFENNVVYHFAFPNWNVPAGVSDAVFSIKGNNFSNGADAAGRAFLQDAHTQIVANGFADSPLYQGGVCVITDTLGNGARQNKISRIEFHNNTVTAHYNGFSFAAYSGAGSTYAFEFWVRDDGEVSWKGNKVNLVGLKFPAASPSSTSAIPISVPFGTWLLDGDEIKWPENAEYANTSYAVITPISITWTSNIATISIPAGHGWQDGEIVTIAGAAQDGYNGTQKLKKISTDSYTYMIPDPGSATATGGISATVKDRAILITTGGINIQARNVKFDLNNARLIGSATAGRRSQSTFSGKTRKFTGCEFSFLDPPFQFPDDPYFVGLQTAGSFDAQRNTYSNRDISVPLPDGNFLRADRSMAYSLQGVSKTVGQDVFYIIVDRRDRQTITISTNDGSADLRIDIPHTTLLGITGSSGNGMFALSTFDSFFDDGGAKKIKITIKAKVTIADDCWGRISVSGSQASLGVERVVKL